jgi:putative zinc finger protein
MLSDNLHLSEHDLILAADGELPPRRRAQVNAHLETCWSCRERMLSVENTITDFVRARNRQLNEQLPSVAGPRALLRARLAEAASSPSRFSPPVGRLAVAGGAFAAVLVTILLIFESTVNAEGPKPRFTLTPGETRPITLEEVCLYDKAEVISRDIPLDVQQKVFAAYGIKSPQKDQFEVDYLITPDLGGTESIRNLWPQPYSVRWNAHVKDKLEERLHELVCGGKLDLATAQHDIAVDWIAAYRKYVGGDTPRQEPPVTRDWRSAGRE